MRILLSILTFWIWIPLLIVSALLQRIGLQRAGYTASIAAIWLSNIEYNVQ